MKNVITNAVVGASMFVGIGALASPAQQGDDAATMPEISVELPREERICKEKMEAAIGEAWAKWRSFDTCVAQLKQRPDEALIRPVASTVQLDPTSVTPEPKDDLSDAEHEKAGGFSDEYKLAIRLSEGTEMDRQPELAIRHLEAIVKGTRNPTLKSDAEARLVELKLLLPYGGLPARLRANFPYFEESYVLYDDKRGPKALVTSLKHPYYPFLSWQGETAEAAESSALNMCETQTSSRCATIARNYEYVFAESLNEIAMAGCKPKKDRQRKICADKQVQYNLEAIKKGFLKKQQQAQRAARGPSGLGKALKYVLSTAGEVMLMGLGTGAFASAYAPGGPPTPAQSFVNGARAGREALGMPASPTLDMLERSFAQMTPITSTGTATSMNTGGFGFIKAQVPLSSGYASCVYSDGSTDVVYRANCSYTTSASSFRKERVLGLSGVPTLVHQETFLGSIERLCVYSDGSSIRDSDGLCQRRRIGF